MQDGGRKWPETHSPEYGRAGFSLWHNPLYIPMLFDALSTLVPLIVQIGSILMAGAVVALLATRSGHHVIGRVPQDE